MPDDASREALAKATDLWQLCNGVGGLSRHGAESRAASRFEGETRMLLRMSLLAVPLGVSAVFYGASTTPAHAYIDPATGSMILQVLLGGAAGAALTGKYYWRKFKAFLGFAPSEAAPVESDEAGGARRQTRAGK